MFINFVILNFNLLFLNAILMKSAVFKNAKYMSSSSSTCTALLSCQFGMCRICMEESDNRRLLRPCKCKGTQAFVHQICLETWLKHKNDKVCYFKQILYFKLVLNNIMAIVFYIYS